MGQSEKGCSKYTGRRLVRVDERRTDIELPSLDVPKALRRLAPAHRLPTSLVGLWVLLAASVTHNDHHWRLYGRPDARGLPLQLPRPREGTDQRGCREGEPWTRDR